MKNLKLDLFFLELKDFNNNTNGICNNTNIY